MDELQQLFDETLAKLLAEKPVTEAENLAIADALLKQMLGPLTETMRDGFKKNIREHLAKEEEDRKSFEERNYKRWREAFELLELMWVISYEVGSAINTKHRPQAAENKEYEFEALTYLLAFTRAARLSGDHVLIVRGLS